MSKYWLEQVMWHMSWDAFKRKNDLCTQVTEVIFYSFGGEYFPWRKHFQKLNVTKL